MSDSTPEAIEKVAIVISKGSLEAIYPGLIMANGARMEGIEAHVFFITVGEFYELAAGGEIVFT